MTLKPIGIDDDGQLPARARTALAGNFADTDTPEGAALRDTIAEGVGGSRPTTFPAFARAFRVRRLADFSAVSDYDINTDRPAAGVTYYTAPGASGAAAGTINEPCSFSAAVSKSDVGTIVMLAGSGDGEYFADETDKLLDKNLNILGPGLAPGTKRVLFTGFVRPSSLTWTLHSGNVYKATIGGNGAQFVIDKRYSHPAVRGGDHPAYAKKADVASITGPGQWAYVGTEVYVWALGNANLVTDSSFMRVSKAGFTGLTKSGNRRVYVEGIEVHGTGWASSNVNGVLDTFGATVGGVSLIKDVRIRYCPLTGFRPKGDAWSAAINVEVSSCTGDGLGYQSNGGVITEALEVGCYGHDLWATDPGAFNINASTAHDDVTIIRVGTRGERTQGPIFADVSGAKSWNIACEARDSTSPTGQGDVGFQALDSDSEMWLDSCYVTGQNLGVNAGNGAPVHTRDMRYANNTNNTYLTGTGSSITPY
ncbi:hypothetical protein AB0P19_02380 [Microbacterium oleivorans]|uniref:hypothetical protein n=1 Tax=Microbacterium oleivorans TaxID=273677 RepID=UPI00342E6B0A